MGEMVRDTIKRILKEEFDESSIDKSIFNFLRRHSNIDEKSFGDDDSFKVKTISFNFDGDWYNFSSFMSKKEIKNKILRMLEDNDIIRMGEFNPRVLETDRQKVVRTIKHFIDVAM
jgi:hypothetical protein